MGFDESSDERVAPRRRTSFEKDLRELVLKVVLGCVLAVVLKVWTGIDSWLGPLIVANLAVFWLASMISGHGRHQD